MKKEAEELALLLKKRDNKKFEPVVFGKVISLNPFKVNDGDNITLHEHLILTLRIRQLLNTNQISIGNEVLLLTNDNNKYAVIDKVVR